MRDKLLKEVKGVKSEEYKEGYADGVLDIYSLLMKQQKVIMDDVLKKEVTK